MITARTAVVEIGKGVETMGTQIEESYTIECAFIITHY